MQGIYDLLIWFKGYVEKPPFYGVYHLTWILLLFTACLIYIFISKSKKINKDKFYRTTIFVCWILLVLFEIVKEVTVCFSMNNGIPTLIYNFAYFPFQLCSLPFYFLPFIIFTENDKIRQFFVVPTVTFIFLGGLIFFFIPGSLCNIRYINFHTFAHHGLQVFTSFICVLWFYRELSIKHFIKMFPGLLTTFSLSIFLNVVLHKYTSDRIQLWNLSPYVKMDLDYLENIRTTIGYVPYVLLYFLILSALSLLLYMIPLLIKKIRKQ